MRQRAHPPLHRTRVTIQHDGSLLVHDRPPTIPASLHDAALGAAIPQQPSGPVLEAACDAHLRLTFPRHAHGKHIQVVVRNPVSETLCDSLTDSFSPLFLGTQYGQLSTVRAPRNVFYNSRQSDLADECTRPTIQHRHGIVILAVVRS